MSNRNIFQALQSAGGAGGAALNVEDVFSTYLYTGNGSTQTITNGIDLDGEGGLVWIKSRSHSYPHNLYDTERGATKRLKSSSTAAESTLSTGLTAFSSNGFTLGGDNDTNGTYSDAQYASWTFLKSKRFFDIQTWTGNSTAGRTISHNLEAEIGFIAIKCTSASGDWMSWHRSASTYAGRVLKLNATDGAANISSIFNSTNPTSTEFTLGSSYDVNGNGQTYVAYLFAHNDGDGEFGPTGDQDIIKCGSYTGTGHPSTPSAQQTIELGFEPQWFLTKRTNSGASWQLVDNMRGMADAYERLYPDQSAAEDYEGDGMIPTATGIKFTGGQAQHNASGGTYIYIAIRRPTAVPESATDVFGISYAQDENTVPFPVDFMLTKANGVDYTKARDRLRGGTKYLLTSTTHADLSGTDIGFDDMTGTGLTGWGTSFIHYNWKRAPKYMDVVAYEGTGSVRTVSHNLGVAPEMMWIKRRDSTGTWCVYHTGLDASSPEDYFLYLDTQTPFNNANMFNDTAPTSSVFTVNNNSNSNTSGGEYIAYLFATVAGVSKVGSVTHSGTTNVDCGFSSGARFVLLKRTDATGDWYVWDSERGIVSANSPYFLLNSTAAEVTNTDYIDPLSSGFTITSSLTAGDYIFYAIA